uniref:protein dopey-1-like n=1 Tax=Styela clava TaxID=7725 RepID=UPI0019398F69|nr:protein dopey-1-like [Styela clava]
MSKATISEQKFYDDPKYRSYASQIEKALKNFEYSTEWADLISALVKLNKVLQANTSFELLPKRITIGKRLSQCLHPALPGGVHIKALDVYDTIFKIIGKKRLEMDLHIYGSGIFSLLANSSMQVRPVLLNVYETHLLPLGEKLRISMDGVLLGLLPGLEEASEHFDRITLLLDKISKGVGLQYFYSSIWRCVLTSPSASVVRLAAMQLILRQFDKKKMTDDQLYLIGLDVDMMVHAVCEALQDENILTQRATLDVLGLCFPLSSLPISRSDMQQILSAALYILLRRDMSLNRRLYSWILGTDVSKAMSKSSSTSLKKSVVKHFETYSRDLLTSAVLDMINKHVNIFEGSCCNISSQPLYGSEVKLIRIVISILDKSEVGPVILNDILISILRLIESVSSKYTSMLSPTTPCKSCAPKHDAEEICLRAQSEFIKSVNLFINTFETDYIWNILAENLTTACEVTDKARQCSKNDFDLTKNFFTISEICDVIGTFLNIVSMEAYVEIQTVYLPDLLSKIFADMTKYCETFAEMELSSCLKLAIQILKHIQPHQQNLKSENNNDDKNGVKACIESFKHFVVEFITSKIIKEKQSLEVFVTDFQATPEGPIIPTGYEVLLKYSNTRRVGWEHVKYKTHENNDIMLSAFKDLCKLLIDLCCFPTFSLPKIEEFDTENLAEKSDYLPKWILCLIACSCCQVFESESIFPQNQSDLEYFNSVRMTACSTALELMAVTASYFEKNSNLQQTESERSVVSVVVPPPLSLFQFQWIFEETNFCEWICKILWSELEDSTNSHNNSSVYCWTCSRALILLHQLSPDEAVERILLQDILSVIQSTRVIAIKKFAKLWHHIRDAPHSYESNKTFSRCLFAILDQLAIERYELFPDATSLAESGGQGVVATTVSTWLRHALEEGDLCRILEPYILISLDGRTHRKSLQNVLEYRNENPDTDQILNFEENFSKQLSEPFCHNCAELQRELANDSSSWSKYQNFSVDSVLTFALCEVHQQIAKERHRYEHLIGLLTLSDEVESIERLKSTCNEEDVHTWAAGFVKMVIAQGITIYKEELENSDQHSLLNSNKIEQSDSLDMGDNNGVDNYSSDSSDKATEAIELNQSFMNNGNPLYNHILVYQERFDANCVLYSLQGILNLASAHPGVFMYAACTTSLASSEGAYSNLVQELLIRHERSIEQGRCFYETTSPSLKGAMKNRMLVEVLISICLYYLRSAFYNDKFQTSCEQNQEIQCIAARMLKFIIRELTILAQQDDSVNKGTKLSSSTKQFSAYIILVLQRQQVQSVVLTCLLTAIFALKNQYKLSDDDQSISTISETLEMESNLSEDQNLRFDHNDRFVSRYIGADSNRIKAIFSQFLHIIFELVSLEYFAFSKERNMPTTPQKPEQSSNPSIALKKKHIHSMKPKLKRSQRLFSHLLSASHRYDSDAPIASQKVFVSTILEIYRLEKYMELHQDCSIGLHSVLPYLGGALSQTVVPIVLQQCLNLETVSKQVLTKSSNNVPPNYLQSTIKSIMILTHYCLLTESGNKNSDSGNSDSLQSDTISLSSTKTNQSVTRGSSIGSGLSTLLSVFNSSNSNKTSNTNETERFDGLVMAKVAILNNLARIVSCMCVLWKDVASVEDGTLLPIEGSRAVSYNILQLLGPLAIQYGEYLLVAFSLVWRDRESEINSGDHKNGRSLASFLKPSKDLNNIIDFMMAIKLLSTERFFSLVKQVIKSPPSTTNEHKNISLQESILQMLLSYMKRLKPGALMENWSGFHGILQEAIALGFTQNNPGFPALIANPISSNCYFLMLYLLSEYVKRSAAFSEKKEQKELQEIVTKCIEACNSIAGSSLEQGTWIRRNVSVLPGPQEPEGHSKVHKRTESQSSLDLTDVAAEAAPDLPIHVSSSDTMVTSLVNKHLLEIDESRPESARERPTSLPQVSKPGFNPVNFRNSVKALTVLSEVVANLLDVIYSSEEKEKVLPLLVSIMANVTPYLRNHGKNNAPSFCSCISFLASISGFQYTRRSWRKDVIDLFLDAPFFHMPQECAEGWKTIIDNLMTHDKTTFKEVMSRTTLSKPGASTPTLNIFTNKEQELELRALHIKRLAFIVFSSELDQYQKQLPEIQERLAESIRLNNVPGVQCRVFLCFRVLLLRISPHSLTSLWPTMFTEMVHAMLQLEQALQPSFQEENHKFKQKPRSPRGSSPSENQKSVMTCWLDMYLSACKLLDLALCLPVHYVPQFQLYRWTFIGDATTDGPANSEREGYVLNGPIKDKETTEPDEGFVPHCVRIQRLFSDLYPSRKNKLLTITPEKPLLNVTRLKSLDQLQLFFNTITSSAYILKMQKSASSSKKRTVSSDVPKTLPMVDKYLERDFVRPLL